MIDVASTLQTGLAGRYEIRRELGHGGMARVYLAEDLRHGREVALKVLRPDVAAAMGSERFLREIRVEGGLQHPQILPLFDSGEADGLLYYVMPYVPGESLRQRLEREKQLPVGDAVRIALEVADALEYAHSRGIVHRDIKPENILLSQGHAVVADFGIARAVSAAASDRLTGTGLAVGTPAYMSPEQGVGTEEVDGRSDVYSLGCVLYEMLAGDPPFSGRTAQAIIARHVHDHPPSLHVVRPSVPPAVNQAVETALAKVPADRYPSAAEFAKALVSTSARQGLRLTRRQRTWAGGVAIAGAAAVGILALRSFLAASRLPAPDPNQVVVFPFRDIGAPSDQSGVGEDVARYIGYVLDGSEPLRWEEAPAQQFRDPPDSGPARARPDMLEFSRHRGAGFYIGGTIVRDSDSVTVLAQLHDVGGDSLMRRSGRSAPVGASVARLGALAVADLLPALLEPERRVDVGLLADRQPAAIANFLQGERQYRRSRFPEALEHYSRALREDSLFALAAVKGAGAASWMDRPEEAERLADLAVRGESRLPTRYAEFSRGLRDYFKGAADSAVGHLRRALTLAPDWSEAWMGLGEVYHHLLPHGGSLDSLAEDSFRRALRNDSTFSPPLYHLAEIALRRDSLAVAEHLAERLRRQQPDSTLSLSLDLMLGCASGRLTSADWGRWVRRNYQEVLDAAHSLSKSPRDVRCAETAFREVFAWDSTDDSHRFGALFGLQNLLVSQRRFDEVRALLQSERGKKYGGDYFFLLDAAAVGAFDQEADDVARAQGRAYESMTTRRLWILGLWAAKRDRVSDVRQIAATLALKADSTGDRRDRLFSDVIAAHAALAEGDSALALRRLQALTPAARRNEIAWSLWEPLGPERQASAELFLAQGDARRALEVASGFDAPGPVAYLLYLPNSLAVRARAALALGDKEAAGRYASRLAALLRPGAHGFSSRANPSP